MFQLSEWRADSDVRPIPRIAACAVLVVALTAVAFAAPSLAPRLSTFWDDWLADTGLLMSPREAEFFAALEDDDAREAFAARFWEIRGDEALERWAQNHRVIDQLRPRSRWTRRAVLLFGKPASIDRIESCGGLRPLQIWRWEAWHVERQGGPPSSSPTLAFVQESRLLPDSYRPWDPTDVADLGYTGSSAASVDSYLDQVRPTSCIGSGLRTSLNRASSFAALRQLMPWPTPDGAWLDSLAAEASDPARRFDASLSIDFTGTHGRHTILHGVLRIKRERLHELVPGQLFDRVAFVGDVYKSDYLVDSFEVVHHVAGSPPGEVVELDLFRGLRPGVYRMEIRVFDRNGLTLLHTDRELEVPKLTDPAPSPPGRRQGYGRLTADDVVLLDTFPAIEVLPVSSRATARTELLAITTGGPIARVAFYVDGKLAAEDDASPYATTVVLDQTRHLIEAVALDADGRELTRHSRSVEVEARPFELRLRRAEGRRVPVLLSIPEGSTLSRLECFDGRALVETLTTEPFDCPPPERYHGGLRYVRAKATLDSGATAEHILFYGPRTPENIDVQLVQLYLSVFDANGRPVPGLTGADFRVWEEGRQLQLDRLESLADLPISVAVLMDLSSSMGRLAGLAADSAQGFFENVMAEGDLASLLAFNDGFYRLVPFTGDINELRLGAEGVRALGSTRLNDGVVWALSQYAGQENRRALVILSDGADVDSDYPTDQVVAAASDAGVVVYPISLVRRGERPPDRLEKLARDTGGTRFVVGTISELDEAFRRIAHELRSQYLLVYRQPDDTATIGAGAVDIEVLRSGHTTRNIRGYYQ